MENFALVLINLAAVYLVIGLIFAVLFITHFIYQVDESAEGSPLGFRLLIVPGCVALWPVLLRRYLNKIKKP